MPSSSRRGVAWAAVLTVLLAGAHARAEGPTGFALERLVTAAPGSGGLVTDDLAMGPELSGAAAFTVGYARMPLRVAGRATVSDQAFASAAASVSYERFRVAAELTKPLWMEGAGAALPGVTLAAPSVDAANTPDLFSDLRLRLDVRLLGEATSALRVGAGLDVWVPSGEPASYVTDGDYRAAGRIAVAADAPRWLTSAAQVGVHVRDRDLGDAPSVPRGSELFFAASAGAKLDAGAAGRVVVGPELFGATATRCAFATDATALEALLSARLARPLADGATLTLRLGLGTGVVRHFGAPEWRSVAAIEIASGAGPR